jgi:four helix bundle suffix protein
MFLRAVAAEAILGENRLNIAHEINRACGSLGQWVGGGRHAHESKRRAGKKFPETNCVWSQKKHNNGRLKTNWRPVLFALEQKASDDKKKPAMREDGKNANDESYGDKSHPPHPSHSAERLLPPRGDYRTLISFQKAEIVYDITFRFAHKFLSKGDRTIDQMIQSARSGKKNILEGSKAALTSTETEIKLTNVARASLEELLDDYRDYLRARDLAIWDKDSKEAQFVRKLGRRAPQTYEDCREFVETRPPEVVANIALCLVHQTNYLIDQQLRRLEQDFVKKGGLRERMTRVRLQHRIGMNAPQKLR